MKMTMADMACPSVFFMHSKRSSKLYPRGAEAMQAKPSATNMTIWMSSSKITRPKSMMPMAIRNTTRDIATLGSRLVLHSGSDKMAAFFLHVILPFPPAPLQDTGDDLGFHAHG